MYRDAVERRPVVGGPINEEVVLEEDEEEESGRAGGGLMGKQERLERAARLLNQGAARDEEKP